MVPARPTSEQAGIKGRVFPKQNKDRGRAGLGWINAVTETPIKLKGCMGVDARAYMGVGARAYMSYFPC